jgi:hypothetical protein
MSHRELLVASKADLTGDAATAATAGVVWTSAVSGAGVAVLAEEIVRRLVPEEADDPALLAGAVPFTARQVALVRLLYSSFSSFVRPRT